MLGYRIKTLIALSCNDAYGVGIDVAFYVYALCYSMSNYFWMSFKVLWTGPLEVVGILIPVVYIEDNQDIYARIRLELI